MKLSILILFGSALLAQSAEVRLTPVTAGERAVQKNPALAAARFKIEEARGRLTQSGRLANPDLEFEFRHMSNSGEGVGSVAFMQKFPVTHRLRLEKAVSRAELAAAEAEVRDAERKLRATAQALAIKILALQEQRELRGKQLQNSREAADVTLKRAAVGEASTADAAQFELEAQQLDVERLQLDVERVALLGELRSLIALRSSDNLSIAGELPSPAKLPAANPEVTGRPDVIAAKHMAEAARQSVALARENKWEDFGAGLVAEVDRSEDVPEGLSTDLMLGFRITMPLPIWNRNEGKIQESIAAAGRAQKETEARVVEARGEAHAARSEMAALARVISDMDEKLLPKSRDLESRLRQIYAAGQGMLTDVLRATERRLMLESRRLDALRDYHLARSRYAAAVGKPLKP
jgi:cobalt-zinc-cadmium efflux system outer membrane protein